MQTKFISFLSLLFLIPAISFGEGKRTELESEYPFVGQIQKNGIGGCTGFLLKHGVLATAKHCFVNYDINPLNFNAKEFSLVFPQKDMLGIVQDFIVEGKDIIKLHLDSGTNDLAYIIYKKEATAGKIDIHKYKINLTDDIEKDTQVFRIGYPQSSKTPRGSVRTLTNNCGFTGKTDFMAPTLSSETYDGLLYDTNCPAWNGDSGGPIFTESEADGRKELTLQGILAHTFEIGFDGQINADAMKEDKIGKFARSSNYSPMLLAEDYELVLDEAARLNGEGEEEPVDTLDTDMADNNVPTDSDSSTETPVVTDNTASDSDPETDTDSANTEDSSDSEEGEGEILTAKRYVLTIFSIEFDFGFIFIFFANLF